MEVYVDVEDRSRGTSGGRMTQAAQEAARARIARQGAAWERDMGEMRTEGSGNGVESERGGVDQPGVETGEGSGSGTAMMVWDEGIALASLDVVDYDAQLRMS